MGCYKVVMRVTIRLEAVNFEVAGTRLIPASRV